MHNLIGQTLKQRYQVIESLGRGGMAEVYKVYDAMRASHLAMKVLREDLAQDKIFLRRFQREAQALAKLQHRHIVRFYGLEQDDALVFMLMDFVDGRSLREDIFRAEQPFSAEKAIQIITPVCAALHYAHQMGMLHCDIKPGNILLTRHDEVLLTDFGIARMSDSATATLVGAGTPAYMSPELVKGLEPTPQTDIYALGVVLYEMLTGGERPFTGEQASITGTTAEKVRWEQVNLPPTPPSRYHRGIPQPLEQIILRCLQKDPSQRFNSCLELLNALNSIEVPTTSSAAPPADTSRNLPPMPVQPASAAIQDAPAAIPTEDKPRIPQSAPAQPVPVAPPVASASKPKLQPAPAKAVKASPVSREQDPGDEARISPKDGMRMLYVPAGEFIMGSDSGESDEQPAHTVYLDAFWIDQMPVTNAMFARFLTDMQKTEQIDLDWIDVRSTSFRVSCHNGFWQAHEGYERHPVVCVSWFGAQAYSQWAWRRLPSEAEWEKAARGTDGRMYPWGNQAPDPELLNFDGNMGGTTPVGSFPLGASPYGALDMAGNVWEWVADWYDEEYYYFSPRRNPPGPSTGVGHVQRGGAWDDGEWSTQTSIRDWDILAYKGYDSGFRCAQTA